MCRCCYAVVALGEYEPGNASTPAGRDSAPPRTWGTVMRILDLALNVADCGIEVRNGPGRRRQCRKRGGRPVTPPGLAPTAYASQFRWKGSCHTGPAREVLAECVETQHRSVLSVAPLPSPFGIRPVALRPAVSDGLPFRGRPGLTPMTMPL